MKKSIKISVNIIISILIFSSCTLTKRHYNNGYYVEYKKSKITEKLSNKEKIVLKNKAELISDSMHNDVALEINAEESDKIDNINSKKNIDKSEVIRKKKFNDTVKSINYKKLNGAVLASNSKALYMDLRNDISDSSAHDNDKDGLSLFWIVILILLLLWAFGFVLLANGLIHLLLVLALILLILWLLRII